MLHSACSCMCFFAVRRHCAKMAEQQLDGREASAQTASNEPANHLQQIVASIIESPRFQQAVVEILGETSTPGNNRPRAASGPTTLLCTIMMDDRKSPLQIGLTA